MVVIHSDAKKTRECLLLMFFMCVSCRKIKNRKYYALRTKSNKLTKASSAFFHVVMKNSHAKCYIPTLESHDAMFPSEKNSSVAGTSSYVILFLVSWIITLLPSSIRMIGSTLKHLKHWSQVLAGVGPSAPR